MALPAASKQFFLLFWPRLPTFHRPQICAHPHFCNFLQFPNPPLKSLFNRSSVTSRVVVGCFPIGASLGETQPLVCHRGHHHTANGNNNTYDGDKLYASVMIPITTGRNGRAGPGGGQLWARMTAKRSSTSRSWTSSSSRRAAPRGAARARSRRASPPLRLALPHPQAGILWLERGRLQSRSAPPGFLRTEIQGHLIHRDRNSLAANTVRKRSATTAVSMFWPAFLF